MTVKELMDILNSYEFMYGEEFTSMQIVMVGHDIDGERQYNIPVTDFTFNTTTGRLTLWDR